MGGEGRVVGRLIWEPFDRSESDPEVGTTMEVSMAPDEDNEATATYELTDYTTT